MVPGTGGEFSGAQTEKEEDMIYKRYVKGKGKFTTQNPQGALIGQEMKNSDKNSEKHENDDDKKLNPVQYSCKPSVSKRKPASYRISKLVPGAGTYIRRTFPTDTNNCKGNRKMSYGTFLKHESISQTMNVPRHFL